MTPEKQRIAIAEACGRVQRPDGSWYPDGKDYGSQGIPDYLNDLNAMHKAEKILTNDQHLRYFLTLTKVCTGYALPEFFGSAIRASVEQRAKAFLRTIGKWEDDK